MRSAHYEMTIDVVNRSEDDPRRPPSMDDLLEAVVAVLDRLGYSDRDYVAEIEGPPELRIVMVPR